MVFIQRESMMSASIGIGLDVIFNGSSETRQSECGSIAWPSDLFGVETSIRNVMPGCSGLVNCPDVGGTQKKARYVAWD